MAAQLFSLQLLREIAQGNPHFLKKGEGHFRLLGDLLSIASSTSMDSLSALQPDLYHHSGHSGNGCRGACQQAAVQILGLLAVHDEQAARVFMQQLVPQTIRAECDNVWQTVSEHFAAVKACWPALSAALHTAASWKVDAGGPYRGLMGQAPSVDSFLNVQRAHRLAMLCIS